MIRFEKKDYIYKIYSWLPIIILFVSVLNEFDLNYLNIDYFSFNFPFILIFYFALKEYEKFDYLLVFIAGLINDTVVGFPLGISSFSYIVVCIFAIVIGISITSLFLLIEDKIDFTISPKLKTFGPPIS